LIRVTMLLLNDGAENVLSGRSVVADKTGCCP